MKFTKVFSNGILKRKPCFQIIIRYVSDFSRDYIGNQ